jgi:hypothetical protein
MAAAPPFVGPQTTGWPEKIHGIIFVHTCAIAHSSAKSGESETSVVATASPQGSHP